MKNTKAKVTVDINAAKIMKEKGISGNQLRQHLASEVKRFCDPYVPMQNGVLKNTAVIANDGSSLTYVQPYAHYQYYGQVMGPNYTNGERFWSGKAPKQYTGEQLTYTGGPMRGPRWVERMLIDKKDDLAKSVEEYINKQG